MSQNGNNQNKSGCGTVFVIIIVIIIAVLVSMTTFRVDVAFLDSDGRSRTSSTSGRNKSGIEIPLGEIRGEIKVTFE